MSERKVQWKIRPGDPERLGVTRTADGWNFALELCGEEDVSLEFFRKGQQESCMEITLPRRCRTGNVWAVTVMQPKLSSFAYRYRQGERTFADPWAPLLWGKGAFGTKPEDYGMFLGGILPEGEVSELPSPISFEDMVIYKVHVRGYTMQKNSKVKKKGTFRGLQEKIPYFRELGITSLELMPAYEFQEYPLRQEKAARYQPASPAPEKLNYWGYAPGDYFAPKTSYCAGKDPGREVKDLVEALHEAGMECLMDFYFPGEIRPDLTLQVLRFWRREYRVDGFVLLGDGVRMEYLAKDPMLADVKFFCPGCDIRQIYGNRLPQKKQIGEYNCGFQDAMRRFLKGDEDQINSFQYYVKKNPAGCGTIQYMANHDGFTLADLVSYDYRHNEENGEANRDGTGYNYSWNCGAEGPTRRTAILELRRRQMRNAVLLLMLSQGTPLLLGGDEFGNSQGGNNNAYCQDNATGWTDWSSARKFAGFTEFVKSVIRFRKAHPILHMPCELRATDYRSLGWPEISFHSERAWYANQENTCREIGVLYCGAYARKEDGSPDDFLYVIYNMHWSDHVFALPDLPEELRWHLAVDSGKKDEEAVCAAGEEIPLKEKKSLKVGPRRILVLIGKQG